ncbi:hypothetical protein V5O48_010119, partial [Marasmius crinis-equi]
MKDDGALDGLLHRALGFSDYHIVLFGASVHGALYETIITCREAYKEDVPLAESLQFTIRMANTVFFERLLCAMVGAVFAASSSSAPIVDLGYAQYQGIFNPDKNVTDFRGVRYAAPPIGDLRWREPQTPEKVDGVQQADRDPPSCFQAPDGGRELGVGVDGAAEEKEDCLFLNLAIPGGDIPGGLPVVVWIHGGG